MAFDELLNIFFNMSENYLNDIRKDIGPYGIEKGLRKKIYRDDIRGPFFQLMEDEDITPEWLQENQEKLADIITKKRLLWDNSINDNYLDLMKTAINDTLESESFLQYWIAFNNENYGKCDYQLISGANKGKLCNKICLIVSDEQRCYLHIGQN